MTRNWNDLEGLSLGRYWLKVCLTSSADDAWYLIRYDTTRDAAVRVLSADAPDAAGQLELWRQAIGFDHPHIVRMLDAGRAETEGAAYIFAVCEYPDDFLAAALAGRPLSPSEARDILAAALSALDYLHDRGLVHGAVDAGHIMAFGDTIKLPSDTIRRAGPDVSPASDMRSLGVLLHQVLTRDVPRGDAHTDFSYLPEPFRSIVRNTVARVEPWTVTDVRNHLNPPPPPKPKPVPEPVAEPVAPLPVARETAPAAPSLTAAPVAESRPILPPPRPRPDLPIDRGFPLKWIPIAGLAAAAALGAVMLRHDKTSVTTAPAVRTAPPTKTPAKPAAPPPATPIPAVDPQPPKPKPFEASNSRADRIAPRELARDARPSTGAPIWRVIAYTYNGRTHAEQKAKTINEKHPAFQAQVFTPKGDRAPYFISLGGRMTLAEAERLQKQARAKGLPRDTFIRNFSN